MYCHVLSNAYYWYSLPLLCVYMWSWELNSGLLCMLWKNSTIQLLLLVLRSVFNKVTSFLTIEFLTDQMCISQTYYTINYLDCFILYRNFFAFAVCDLGILFKKVPKPRSWNFLPVFSFVVLQFQVFHLFKPFIDLYLCEITV